MSTDPLVYFAAFLVLSCTVCVAFLAIHFFRNLNIRRHRIELENRERVGYRGPDVEHAPERVVRSGRAA